MPFVLTMMEWLVFYLTTPTCLFAQPPSHTTQRVAGYNSNIKNEYDQDKDDENDSLVSHYSKK